VRLTRRATFATALFAALAASVTVVAQEHPLVKDHPGAWSVTGPLRVTTPSELTADERAGSTAAMNRLLDIVRRMPTMAPPLGLEAIVHTHLSIDSLDRSDEQRSSLVTMQLAVNLAPYERIDQKVEANERDTVGSVTIRVNDLGAVLGGQLDVRDDQAAFFRATPEPVDTLHGHPVYEEGNGDRWIFIVRNKVPFWAPISRGRYMQAVIKDGEKRVTVAGERRAKLPPNLPASIITTMDEAIGQFQRQLANLKKAYAAMGTAERNTPAVIAETSAEEAPIFAPPGDDPTAVIVQVNPALADAKLPRSTPQILAIRLLAKDDLWPGMAARLDKELDWAALEAFVRQ
jgi:hypothetical protein